MHRITTWYDDEQRPVQVSVACLDQMWEVHVEVTEQVGPFYELAEATDHAVAVAHSLGGWRAHQLELL